MSAYNPNAAWESKQKQYEYTPAATPPPKPPVKNPLAPPEPDRGPSFFSRHGVLFFSIGLALFFALAGFVVYLLLPSSSPNVAIAFSKPDNVLVGQPFILSLSLSNESNSILKNGSFTLMLPEGISFVGQPPDQRALEQDIGDMGAQDIKQMTFTLIVSANPKSVQHIDGKLLYGTDSAGKTQFEADGGVDIFVGDSALTLTFTTPANIFSGQDFDIVVNYMNNTATDIKNLAFNMQYPPAFNYKKSSLAPGNNTNNAWTIGTLSANATGTFTITGNIVGPEDASYALAGTMRADFGGATYPINTQTTNFTIASAPLALSIDLNGGQAYVAGLSDNLTYTLHYKNNSTVTFRGSTIKATLIGNMFDPSTIHSDGIFDSRTNTLTWFGANTPGLIGVAPGQSGSVNFTVNTRPSFPTRLVSDKNYILKVNAQIQSPTVPPNTAGTNTVSATGMQTKIGGVIAFVERGYYKDATFGPATSGPFPPKVDSETHYTIHWRVSSASTDAQNITISGYLQSGTTFTGEVKSNVSTTPQYDPTTGLVSWTIPVVSATTGVLGPPAEAIFQVANTPAINQVGQIPVLMGPVSFSATDAYTGKQISQTTPALSTTLPDDPSITNLSPKVTQ